MIRNFMNLIKAMWAAGKFACVGLDTDWDKIPEHLKERYGTKWEAVLAFNKEIINATKDTACAYKLNYAFYEAMGNTGLLALKKTIAYIHKIAPEVPVILDFKRADIGNTNVGSVVAGFEEFNADAVTINPYFGQEAVQSFLDKEDKGIIVLARTSNSGAKEFQNLNVVIGENPTETKPLYMIVAEAVASRWNEKDNCLIVVGATAPEELEKVRKAVGKLPILIPGIGKQGGDLQKTLEAGFDSDLEGIIINSSRDIIYASDGTDYALAARTKLLELHEAIKKFRVDAMSRA